MKRIKDGSRVVHFVGCSLPYTLCGKDIGTRQADLFTGEGLTAVPETSAPVTCHDCAKLYCQIKNAPWNEVDDKAMEIGMFACGDSVWCGACGNTDCPDHGHDSIRKCDRFIRNT